jgi:multiple sugar transport system substrate-binding protein
MKFLRLLPLHLPFIFMFFLAAGCGGEGDGNNARSDGRKVIRISHFWGTVQDVWDSAIVEFEKTHPDIKVEQQVLSFNVHVQKMLTATAAGADIGDLLLLEDWFAQEILNRDFFIDLQPMVKRDLGQDAYFPISLETYYDSTKALRAFPIALGSYPLFYNKDLFDKAGIAYPDSTWTYDTLLAVAQKLTKDTDGDGKPDQWGFLLDNSGGFDGVIYSLGGAVLTDDLKRSAFAEPRTIQALHYWVDLVQKYKVAPQNASVMGGSSSGGSLRPFETGRFGMAMLGSMLTPFAAAKFPWNITLPPKGPAGRKALRFAEAFGIPNSSKNPEAAWEFLRWIVEDMPAKYADRMFFGLVPNSQRLASSPEYLNGTPKVDRTVLMEMIEQYSFSYWRSGWQEFRDNGFLPELDRMVSGDVTVEEGAAEADRKINAVLMR